MTDPGTGGAGRRECRWACTATATASGSQGRARRSSSDAARKARRLPELPQEAGAAGGAEAGHPLEGAAGHAPAPQVTVVGDGEAVRLVAHPLQQEQGVGPPRDGHRVGSPRHEHLLEGLGQGGHGDLLGQPQALEDPHPHAELALAPVEEQELGRIGEAPGPGAAGGGVLAPGPGPGLEEGGEAPGEDLLHGRVVVVARHVADAEAPVLGLAGQPVLEDHHRPDVVGALQVAHVVALDPQRGLGQPEHRPQRLEGPGPAVVVRGPAQPVAGELLPGVARHGLQQRPLPPPLRHAQRHAVPPPVGQERLVDLGRFGEVGHEHLAGHARGRGAPGPPARSGPPPPRSTPSCRRPAPAPCGESAPPQARRRRRAPRGPAPPAGVG